MGLVAATPCAERIGVSEKEYSRLFPFHFFVDEALQFVQTGASLAKIEKAELAGGYLPEFFALERPQVPCNFESLKESSNLLFVFRSKAQGYLLRGQMFIAEETGWCGFAGSPWFTRAEELQASGLTFADLALHDPLADLLHLLQSQYMAFDDMQRLTRRLKKKQADLSGTNSALEAGIEIRLKTEAKLRAASRRLTTMIDTLQGAILVEDEERRIVHVNQGFCEMFGVPASPEQMIGLDCATLAEQGAAAFADPELFFRDVAETLERRERVLGHEVRMRDGRSLSRDYSPIYIEGNYAGHFWHYEDITAKRKAQEQQTQLLQKLQKKNEELNEFAYVVSHDLKAPLRGMDALISWLISDHSTALDETGREHLDLLRNRVRRMNALIDGVLQYSRAGRLREELSLVDVADALEEVLELIQVPLTVRVIVQPGLPSIWCERRRLTQIFQNLISNSIKYMDKPQGRVEVSASEHENEWRFRVQDTGPGIDPKYHQKVFQLFQTLTSRDTSESTGIGLAIVKKNVELSGGRVWIESPPEGGAAFVFSLPKTADANVSAPLDMACLC